MTSYFDIAPDTTLAGMYAPLVEYVMGGDEVSPRGQLTYERRNFTLHLHDLRQATFPMGIGRGASTAVLAAELMQWMGGISNLQQLEDVAAVFTRFSDDGKRLNGAYGPRARNGLIRAVDSLTNDRESRQAVVSLWNNAESVASKDVPCTVSWSFMIRDDKLHMTTFMRSNDVWTGVTYDVPAMARIGTAVAAALDVQPGEYTHHVQSMHLYETDIEATEQLDEVLFSFRHADDPPFFDGMDIREYHEDAYNPVAAWAYIRAMAISASCQKAVPKGSPFAWYHSKLEGTRVPEYVCNECYYFTDEPCPDHPGSGRLAVGS